MARSKATPKRADETSGPARSAKFHTPTGDVVQVMARGPWEAYVADSRARALLAQPLEPTLLPITDVEFDLFADQTPIENQDGCGNCWAFAGIAALEAAYKRAYDVTLDLSEQYLTQVNRAGELYPDYTTTTAQHENNSSEWSNQGSSDICDKLVRAPVPDSRLAPNLTQADIDALATKLTGGTLSWNSTQEQLDELEWSTALIPTEARWAAKYRATGSVAVSDLSTDSLERIIASRHEVVVDIALDWKQDARTGIYHYNGRSDGGGHVLLLIGYDKTQQYFWAKNSWGGSDYYKLGYDFIQACCGGAHYLTGVTDPHSPADVASQWLGRWNMDHDGWQGQLVIRRFTDFRHPVPGTPTKLGNYYPRGGGPRRDVNGHFEEGGRAMVFWIADQPGRMQPGTESGQRFDAYIFSWEPAVAAGITTWNGLDYGVRLTRDPVPFEYTSGSRAEDWLGRWAMDHDGWHGTLDLEAVIPTPFGSGVALVSGTYTTADHTTVPAIGTVGPAPHVLNLDIALPGGAQGFHLARHTWEERVFSGTTVWNGTTFGVAGMRDAPLSVRRRDAALTQMRRALEGQLETKNTGSLPAPPGR